MKNIAWLQSIRLTSKNGFMCFEDAERIDQWYRKHLEKTIDKVWNEQDDKRKE